MTGGGPPTLRSTDPRGATLDVQFDPERLGPVRVTDARGSMTSGERDARACKVGVGHRRDGEHLAQRVRCPGADRRRAAAGDPVGDPSVRHSPHPEGAVPFSERVSAHAVGGGGDVVQRDLFGADGHLLVRGTRAEDGTWVVGEATRYNWRGLAAGRATPYRTVGVELDPVGAGQAGESFEYDALGRVVRQVQPGGAARAAVHEPGRSVLHDEEDLVVGGDHEGTPSVFELDCAGRVRRVLSVRTTGGAIATSYRYSIRNKPVSIVDPNGRATTIVYDLEGRQLSVADPDAGTTTFLHDASGNLVERRNGLGQRVLHTHDELNRLRRVTAPDTGDAEVRYEYVDQADTAAGVDVTGRAGRLVEVHDSLGVTSLGYDALGEVTSKNIALDDGREFDVNRVVDRLGRLARVSYPGLGAVPGRDVDYGYDDSAGSRRSVASSTRSSTTPRASRRRSCTPTGSRHVSTTTPTAGRWAPR